MYLISDTETTGHPSPILITVLACIQIAWQMHDEMGTLVEHQDYLVKHEGFNIP